MRKDALAEFFASINVNVEILEKFHSGIAIFNSDAILVFANDTYKKMYRFDDREILGLDAREFFLSAGAGIMEVLRTGEPNSCRSVSVNGLYGITYRWPLKDMEGRVAGCLTENVSVSPAEDRINEVHHILAELEGYEGFSTLFNPRQSTEVVTFDSMVGESSAMRLLKERGQHFARHNEPILILGENGTGKDMVAQAIHAASGRSTRNFIAVNCAAIPHDLLESELFGYEAGAFTGARAGGKKGMFELAEGGTIFLDEIAEVPITLQAKLLRALENHEVQKLGSPGPSHVDFRLVSATNRDLEQMVEDGLFREDLYYRLNLFDLVVPPLRERLADIPLLARAIMTGLLGPERAAEIRIDTEVLSVWSAHPWRGNVRELRNILTYAVYSLKPSETVLRLRHLPERFFRREERALFHPREEGRPRPQGPTGEPGRPADGFPGSLDSGRAEAERAAIAGALRRAGGNKAKAARLLGIARSNLYKKMGALAIDDDAWRA